MDINSERFLNAFNRIDDALRNMHRGNHRLSFSNQVEVVSKDNVVVRRYLVDLLEFSELRNAIVHQRTMPDFVIAEPHTSTVEKIEKIEEEITKPKMVIPQFSQSVQSFDLRDPLSIVLKLISEKAYTQFPVYYDDEFQGLVTANGIANWLAKNVKEDIISIQDASIADVLAYEETKHTYRFISRDTGIYEAEEMFKDHLSNGERLEALLITHNGNQSEKLLGIITTWDIINIT